MARTIHCAYQRKKSKNPRTASEHQEVHEENTKESHGETCRQPSAHIIWYPRGSRAVFAYTGHSEGHKPGVAHHTQPNTMSPRLGGHYKTHGKTHHLGLPAGKQLTTLHQVLRYLWNRHRGGLYIWPKQDRPYRVARRVATEGKVTIQ